MYKTIDITGQRFGRLTVLSASNKRRSGSSCWLCRCDCGTEKIICRHDLLHGTKSCGCLQKEHGRKTIHKACEAHSDARAKERENPEIMQSRKTRRRLLGIYHHMKRRCHDPNDRRYKDYGGRGITVCLTWLSNFEAFYGWSMENGYSENRTIDRCDNDKGYSPDNCRWATAAEQAANKRDNHYVEINGETKIIRDWCIQYNVCRQTFERRLKRGWAGEELLFGRTA